MVTITWILRKLAQSLGDSPTAFSNWDAFCKSSGSHRIFVWEAFISKRKGKLSEVLGDPPTNKKWEIKDAYHIYLDKTDALTAVDAFVEDIGKPTDVDVALGSDVFSLIHSVIAWLGWSVENVPSHVASIVRKRNKPNWDAVPRLLCEVGDNVPCDLREWFVARMKQDKTQRKITPSIDSPDPPSWESNSADEVAD